MDEGRWRQIDDLFDAALTLEGDQRSQLLDRSCRDDPELRQAVERLLELEQESAGFLGRSASTRDAETATLGRDGGAPPTDDQTGRRIGPYRLMSLIGLGGMGAVYLAQREDDFRQEVAIKLVRWSLLGPDARSRLRTEGLALARLAHPNIARLHDGGTTDDGIPYLVMERIEGLRIDRYCDEHRLGIRRRIELVRQVLDAVAHAHHHLCVHCDIKPSNILVTGAGTPKLLDFGIAKLLGSEERARIAQTVTGRRPMTLAYASPEQIRGQPITTASDLYSVGVLLGELLCGRLPYAFPRGPAFDAESTLVEGDPIPPSRRLSGRESRVWGSSPSRSRTEEVSARVLAERRGVTVKVLAHQMRGDLDAIVLKAIRNEPELRYVSAEAFAADLERFLEARPVHARKGNWRYRIGRFVRRLVWAPDPRRRRERWAWAMVVAALAVTATAASWLRRPPDPCPAAPDRLAGVWDPPRRAAVEQAFQATGLPFAEDTWRRVEAGLDRYAGDWLATETESCEATLVRRERSPRLLDLSRLCLESRKQELRALVDLFAQADDALVIQAVAAVSQLGSLRQCTDQAELATRRLPPRDPGVRRRLEGVRSVVETQHLRFRVRESMDLEALRRAEAEVRQLDDPRLLASTLWALGIAEGFVGGDPSRGEARFEEALLAAIAGGDRLLQIRIHTSLIELLAQQSGDFEKARFWKNFAVASLAGLSSDNPEIESEVFEALGALEWHGGDREAAWDHYLRAHHSAERQGDPIRQIHTLSRLGLMKSGKPYAAQAIELIERELGAEHIRLAGPLMNLASGLATESRYAEALPLVRRSYELVRATYGENEPRFGYPLCLIGQILLAQDRPEEALEPLERARELLVSGFGPGTLIVRDAHVALAEALLLLDRVDEANDHLRAVASLGEGVDPDHPSRLNLLRVLGDAQRRSGDLTSALATHRELLERSRWQERDELRPIVKRLLSIGLTFQEAGLADEARPLLTVAVETVSDADRLAGARLRLALAKAVQADEPERARRLAAAARAGLDDEIPLHRRWLRKIEG